MLRCAPIALATIVKAREKSAPDAELMLRITGDARTGGRWHVNVSYGREVQECTTTCSEYKRRLSNSVESRRNGEGKHEWHRNNITYTNWVEWYNSLWRRVRGNLSCCWHDRRYQSGFERDRRRKRNGIYRTPAAVEPRVHQGLAAEHVAVGCVLVPRTLTIWACIRNDVIGSEEGCQWPYGSYDAEIQYPQDSESRCTSGSSRTA